jgi:hypothetical protein
MIKEKQSKQSNKGLQKFTNYETLQSKEEMSALWAKDLDEFNKFGSWVVDRLNEGISATNREPEVVDKYYKLLELFYSIARPDLIEETRRTRWQVNRSLIETAIHNSIVSKNRLPTQSEIGAITGLSRVTVAKHFKEGLGADSYKEEIEGYRLMSLKVLNAMYKMAMNGNDLRAMKTFLDYFKDGPTSIKQQNNYLQFNNTRIDEITVNELPEEARIQIESIIKQHQTAR